MRSLPQGFDDDGCHLGLREPHNVRRQQPLDDQNTVLWNGLQAGILDATESPKDIPPQVKHVIGPLAKRLILQGLEFLDTSGETRGERPSRRSTRTF